MKRKQPEKKLVRDAYINKYKMGVIKGDILWWKILEAENEQFTPAGTLDSVVCVNQRNGSICLWFNEFKAPGKRMVKRRGVEEPEENYRYEQRAFVDSMKGKPKIYCSITDDVFQYSFNLRKAMEV